MGPASVIANEIRRMDAELAVTPDPAILSIAVTRKPQACFKAKAGDVEAKGARMCGGMNTNAGRG
jgi:hypothetical protein